MREKDGIESMGIPFVIYTHSFKGRYSESAHTDADPILRDESKQNKQLDSGLLQPLKPPIPETARRLRISY